MKYIKLSIFGILLLILPILTYAQVGCCTNPGAGLLTCFVGDANDPARLVDRNTECCPSPSTNPEYYNFEGGPRSQSDCFNNFFSENQFCEEVNKCKLGCCCASTTSGLPLSGELTSLAQCVGSGNNFQDLPDGQTCVDVCNVPQCNDGIDNDKNGCFDFPLDSGCTSVTDISESGGSCFVEAPLDCDNSNFVPRILNFITTQPKGLKKVELQWENECVSKLNLNNIYRCEGANCNNFGNPIFSTTQNIFIDDSNLEFETSYTYKIESKFNGIVAEPTSTTVVRIGNLECINRFEDNNFCIHESYYNQYEDILKESFSGFLSGDFIRNVQQTFSDKLNRPFFCNDANILIDEGTICRSDQICVISGNDPICLDESECNPDVNNPFGLFFSRELCEGGITRNYCFFDRSISSIDSCFECSPQMACNDYKSRDSCEINNCEAGNCQWRDLSAELGTGVCVDLDANNCQFCDQPGTPGLESTKAFNSIFEQCGQSKALALSIEPDNICFFNGQASLNCGDITCIDYQTTECNSVDIEHDQFNTLTNPSNDRCEFGVCQTFLGTCRKNADGDSIADCTGENIVECEQDVFAPKTTIIPIVDRGIFKSLSIQIFDKTNSRETFVRRSTNDYLTFICKEPCGFTGHPFPLSTNAFNIIISNLDIFDSITGERLILLDEGPNILRYYSQDPAKNIGEVKTVEVIARGDTSGPIVHILKVTGSPLTEGIIVTETQGIPKIRTNSKIPQITVEFIENAEIISARLLPENTPIAIGTIFDRDLKKIHTFTLPQELPEGKYTLELNAKNNLGIFIDVLFVAEITVDSTKPEFTNFAPSDGEIIIISQVPFTFSFNEPVNLDVVTINGDNTIGNFTTNDDKLFTATITLEDGNKDIFVRATDLAGNEVTNNVNFIVNAIPIEIVLIEPTFGVSANFIFDIKITTDNDAQCKFNIDLPTSTDAMKIFDSTGGTLHTEAFSLDDENPHTLRVFCDDGTFSRLQEFDLSVDTVNPIVITAFADPEIIAEIPRTTTFKIQTDKETICKFSQTQSNFDSMEGEFSGFDNNIFKEINLANVTVNSDSTFNFFAICKSKADRLTALSTIPFSANINIQLEIISRTPPFTTTGIFTLALETNKRAECFFDENPKRFDQGFSRTHTKTLSKDNGQHTIFVQCITPNGQETKQDEVIIVVDTTAPNMLFVDDTSQFEAFPEFTCIEESLNVPEILRAGWDAEDLDSGVKIFHYSVIKEPNEIVVERTNEIFRSTEGNRFKFFDVPLEDGETYFFSVSSTNFVELEGSTLNSNGITVDTSLCEPDPFCGDGKIDGILNEVCDTNGPVFGSVNECTDFNKFISGTLSCNQCSFDTTTCNRPPNCGDGKLDPQEHCDVGDSLDESDDLFGLITSCQDLDFQSGTINCFPNCFIDTTACKPTPTCGNNVIDPGEECDGNNLGNILDGTCSQYSNSFVGGTLSCNPQTCKLDTSACDGIPGGSCGDGNINIGERCDNTGPIFGEITTCQELGFASGTISCSRCGLDTSSCEASSSCGNNNIDPGEECDGNNLGVISNSCSEYSSYFSSGTISCDTTTCKLDTESCIPAPLCGNGFLDSEEECDIGIFAGNLDGTCTGFDSNNFLSGSLSCNPQTCKIDTAACVQSNKCGNNVIEPENDEECDGNNFGSFSGTCTDFNSLAFVDGNLACNPQTCKIETNSCVPIPSCGNGVIDAGETCDDGVNPTNFGPITGTCSEYFDGFTGGNLNCFNCQIDASSCTGVGSSISNNNQIEDGEACDTNALGNIDQCTDYEEFSAGLISCTNQQLDTLACIEVGCGNGFIDPGEVCDNSNLGGETCTSFSGFIGGTLSCDSCEFDKSACIPAPTCGDGNIDPGEVCDPGTEISSDPVFGAISQCIDFTNFIGGDLLCNQNCEFDTTTCEEQPFCGDGKIDPGEHCDGSLLGSIDSCSDLGFPSGSVKCGSNCLLDTSSCKAISTCGNGIVDPGEECDGNNLGAFSQQCVDYSTSFTGGQMSCNNKCLIDTTQCLGTRGTCGDNIINIGETCEDDLFGNVTSCEVFDDFDGGLAPGCGFDCHLDTRACIELPKCGNGIIDPKETCDGDNLGIPDDSCSLYSSFFGSGTITCNDCTLDTFSCESSPKCGNGFLDPGEICDDNNFGNLTSLSCSDFESRFILGSITCDSCEISTRECSTNKTIITCRERGSCRLGETCSDGSQCLTGFCSNNICVEASCTDRIKNQDESDVDCGGSCGDCNTGKSCIFNSDCKSDLCTLGTCGKVDTCNDERLSGTETGIDCGGACPTKCDLGITCNRNVDCASGLICTSNRCSEEIEEIKDDKDKDSDGDGIPDDWELEYGFDPNDPSDANSDIDKDGLINIQEFKFGTNPNKADTDGDGYSDKEEIDEGTDPLDPNSKPKGILGTLILIFVLIIILLTIGFGVYYYISKSKSKAIEPSFKPSYVSQRPTLRTPIRRTKPKEIVKKGKQDKIKQRGRLFDTFDKKKPETKVLRATPTEKVERPLISRIQKKPEKIKVEKEKKQDAFSKLKLISKEERQKKTTRKVQTEEPLEKLKRMSRQNIKKQRTIKKPKK